MTYATVADVAAYASGTGEGGTYTTDTKPTEADVQRFLNAGYSRINGALKAKGYSTPVGSSSEIYYDLVDLEALYAASRVELTRTTGRYQPGTRGRSEVFMEQFKEGLKELLAQDLSQLGVGHSSYLYIGGVSVSDKDAVDADTDRVKPRFERGQFDYPGTSKPGRDNDNDFTS